MANEKTAAVPVCITEKKIGNTTYIVTSRFNGDKGRDITAALIRMVGRDMNFIPKDTLQKAI